MNRLRFYFILIFFAIGIPSGILLHRSYRYLESEALLSYKERGYLLLQILNQKIYDDLALEEKRSYSEYRFIKAVQVIGGEEVTLSDLANFPVRSHYTGILGHFQIEPDGSIRTPLVPDGLLEKIPVGNLQGRQAIKNKLVETLKDMDIQHTGVMKRVSARQLDMEFNQEVLDESPKVKLSTLLQDDKLFKKRFEESSQKKTIVFDVESEAPERRTVIKTATDKKDTTMIMPEDDTLLEVEIEPFQARSNRTYITYFRNVRRNEERFIQGFSVRAYDYLRSMVYRELRFSEDEKNLSLQFSVNDTILARFGSAERQTQILTNPLRYPLNNINIEVGVSDLNRSKGTNFVAGLGMVMLLVLGGGLFGIYNLTSTQIKASKKRQDFISAVSHELKTPLTSIRMYGEMLENGWVVSQERTQHYYRLIASEAERLSRLIQNVLNLSALEKKQWMVNMQPSNPRLFFEDFIAKYRATVERAGFEMDVQMDDFTLDILIDPDACFQILMNITENSLKFSKDFLPKKIDFELRVFPDSLVLSIRDYGPGIPPSEMTKVFDDFYRIENEMIRKTSGTGIGLSLVRHLCNAMNIRVEISNANPGLKSEIRFPTLKL